MTQIKKAHCFFEQSGTFKNEFKKLGIDAEDYDIQNNFGQTDHVIDLFGEIEKEYNNLTRQDKTRQDKHIRQHRPLSRPYSCFLPMYLFYRQRQSLLFYVRKHKL